MPEDPSEVQSGTAQTTIHSGSTWRRRSLKTVAILALAVLILAAYLIQPEPLPEPAALLPPGGRWVSLELPQGLLTEDMTRVVLAALDYSQRPGGLLGQARRQHAGLAEVLDARWHEHTGATRPWRLTYWEGAPEARDQRLLIFSAGGMGKLWHHLSGVRRSGLVTGAGPSYSMQLVAGTLLAGTPELVDRAAERLKGAPRSTVGPSGPLRVRVSCGKTAGDKASWLAMAPAQVSELVLQVRSAKDGWELDYWALAGSALPQPWGLPQLQQRLEADNVSVQEQKASGVGPLPRLALRGLTRPGDGSMEEALEGAWHHGSWQLDGVEQALQDLVGDLQFWTE